MATAVSRPSSFIERPLSCERPLSYVDEGDPLEFKFSRLKSTFERKIEEHCSTINEKIDKGKKRLDRSKSTIEKKFDQGKCALEKKYDQGKKKMDKGKASLEKKLDQGQQALDKKMEDSKSAINKSAFSKKVEKGRFAMGKKFDKGKEKLDKKKDSVQKTFDRHKKFAQTLYRMASVRQEKVTAENKPGIEASSRTDSCSESSLSLDNCNELCPVAKSIRFSRDFSDVPAVMLLPPSIEMLHNTLSLTLPVTVNLH